ncbi:MAG: hypothetical protein IKM34_07520 [Clostridia bacterium]|nr:hypothetical protein [Clostridia bacterium]
MKQIQVIDTTFSRVSGLSFKERLILARQLSALGVDVIEAGALRNTSEDKLFIKTVLPFLGNTTVSALVSDEDNAANAAWEALSPLTNKRLVVEIPTSVVQMEYFCHAKPDKVLEMIKARVSACAALTEEVEFSAADAVRSEPAFLTRACEFALASGAKYITLCDSEGVATPTELVAFLKNFRDSSEAFAHVAIGVRCNDSLSMACANSVAAVMGEAVAVKTSLVGDEAVALSAFVRTVALRGNDWALATSVDPTAMTRVASSMPWLYGEKREGVATAVESVEDSDEILLAKGTTIGQIADVVAHMGYEISSDDLAKVHKAFEKLAERKSVSGKELEIIVANVADEVPPTYILRSYIVNSGDRISPMAQVEIEKDGEIRHGVSIGNGPIDAAFLAVEKVIGSTYELDDFRISSVTRGQEAMGEALVRLRSQGKVYSGSGVSTDIIGASLRAYVNALNKIVFEEQ